MDYKRTKFEILADILRIGGSKTHIMYASNLTSKATDLNLQLLVDKGLMVIETTDTDNPKSTYKTTEKGLDLLNQLDSVIEILS